MTRLFLKLFLWIYLAAGCGMFAVLFVPADSAGIESGSTFMFMLAWSFLYFFSCCYLLYFKVKLRYSYLYLLLFSIYMVLSSSWSYDMGRTFIYSFSLFLNFLFIILVYQNVNENVVVRGLLNVLFILTLISVFGSILGIESFKYNDPHSRPNILGFQPFRGLYNHKIPAGIYTAIGFSLSCILLSGIKRFYFCFIFILFNLYTGSSTGHSMLLIGAFLIVVNKFCVNQNCSPKKYFLRFFILLLITSFISMVVLPSVLMALGRDPTLTGRTVLWGWGISVALERLFFGWGYMSYNGSELAQKSLSVFDGFENYEAPHFHNSYIQSLVDNGLLFTLIFMYFCIYTMYKTYKRYFLHREKYILAELVVFQLILLSAVFVHSILVYNNTFTLIIIYCLLLNFREKYELHS